MRVEVKELEKRLWFEPMSEEEYLALDEEFTKLRIEEALREDLEDLLAPEVDESQKLAQLRNLYSLRDESTVETFLQEHTYLIGLLLEAYWYIEAYFGSFPRVFLEVVIDPEATDDCQLVAYISTTLPPDEALDKLQQLDEDWWLDAMDSSKGKLCIDLEFNEF